MGSVNIPNFGICFSFDVGWLTWNFTRHSGRSEDIRLRFINAGVKKRLSPQKQVSKLHRYNIDWAESQINLEMRRILTPSSDLYQL
jgi:hypothetical protein